MATEPEPQYGTPEWEERRKWRVSHPFLWYWNWNNPYGFWLTAKPGDPWYKKLVPGLYSIILWLVGGVAAIVVVILVGILWPFLTCCGLH
jgi:hypothetical protein